MNSKVILPPPSSSAEKEEGWVGGKKKKKKHHHDTKKNSMTKVSDDWRQRLHDERKTCPVLRGSYLRNVLDKFSEFEKARIDKRIAR